MKKYYMVVVQEVDKNYITYADDYILDPESHSVDFKIDGRVVLTIPLSDPKYRTVTVYNVDRAHYTDPVEMYIGGGAV